MNLNDIPVEPSISNESLDDDEVETCLIFRCCGTEFDNELITDENGYGGGYCPYCSASNPEIERRVI